MLFRSPIKLIIAVIRISAFWQNMEKIATKKFNYDRQSSYKTRGKLGSCTNRNVRVQRASENRHLSRMDEVSKRRRMPLSPLVDENTADSSKSTFATNNTNAGKLRSIAHFVYISF